MQSGRQRLVTGGFCESSSATDTIKANGLTSVWFRVWETAERGIDRPGALQNWQSRGRTDGEFKRDYVTFSFMMSSRRG